MPWPAEIAPTLNAAFGDKQGLEDQHALSGAGLFVPVAHSLRADGFDASEDGTGRGTPIVPVAYAIQGAAGRDNPSSGPDGIGVRVDNCAYTLEARAEVQAVAFDARQSDVIQYGNKTGPLDTDGHSIGVMTLAIRGRGDSSDLEYRNDGTANAILTPNGGRAGIGVGAVAFAQNQRDEVRTMDVAGALASDPGMKQQTYAHVGMQVRRLTPRECERLQGFPDDYTLVTYRGKPAADGPRYKALGNSMAVPVMAWIGRQLRAALEYQQREEVAA